MSELELTEEECMVELTELGDRARGGEDIRWDKVSEVIKKAQLKKLVRELFEPCYGTESYYLAPKGYHRFDIKDDKWQTVLEACNE